MKMVIGIIRPHKLQEVKDALEELGLTGLTVTEVRGHGRQMGQVEKYRGLEYTIDLLPKIKLEIVCEDERKEDVINAIVRAARTGEIGDGKVFVLPVEESVRVRTGDRGEDSI
ncbi:MAG: P-II family nitrogen regulator [Armatimonadetes bacterium]|nr:P-II family nitrogen regulator [Armatimonadota bacterium]